MASDQILYFVKYPEPGKVKTRLVRSIGEKEAANVYRECAEKNFQILRSLDRADTSLTIVFDPPEAEWKIKEWLPGDCSYIPQSEGDLTERLTKAFALAFEREASRTLAVGSDTLGLPAGFIREAFDALRQFDVVLGPAKDGGYYLIGLSKPFPFLFQDIPWSTPAVLETTKARIQEHRLSYDCLPELEDLDEVRNLETYRLSAKGEWPS